MRAIKIFTPLFYLTPLPLILIGVFVFIIVSQILDQIFDLGEGILSYFVVILGFGGIILIFWIANERVLYRLEETTDIKWYDHFRQSSLFYLIVFWSFLDLFSVYKSSHDTDAPAILIYIAISIAAILTNAAYLLFKKFVTKRKRLYKAVAIIAVTILSPTASGFALDMAEKLFRVILDK